MLKEARVIGKIAFRLMLCPGDDIAAGMTAVAVGTDQHQQSPHHRQEQHQAVLPPRDEIFNHLKNSSRVKRHK